MRNRSEAGPKGKSFQLIRSGATGLVAIGVFMGSAAAGFLFLLFTFGPEVNPTVLLVLVFAFAGGMTLLVVTLGERDRCVRIVIGTDRLHLTGSRSGEVELPAAAVEVVFERAPLDSRSPASFWLYGTTFGRVRLIPKVQDAGDLDAALRRTAHRALHIPATSGRDTWQWPRRFDHGVLTAALRQEARSRVQRSLVIGMIMTIGGGTGIAIFVAALLGIAHSGNASVGKGAGYGLLLLCGGVYLLSTTRRSTRWQKGCERIISERVNASFPCPSCGYDMGGLPPRSPCPECGQVPPADPPLDVRSLP